jgi:hypothetical protein
VHNEAGIIYISKEFHSTKDSATKDSATNNWMIIHRFFSDT